MVNDDHLNRWKDKMRNMHQHVTFRTGTEKGKKYTKAYSGPGVMDKHYVYDHSTKKYKKLKEEVEVNELSTNTLKAYTAKAAYDPKRATKSTRSKLIGLAHIKMHRNRKKETVKEDVNEAKKASEISRGTDHEMEHTNSRGTAKKIARDHLRKNKHYYRELEKCMPGEKTEETMIDEGKELKHFTVIHSDGDERTHFHIKGPSKYAVVQHAHAMEMHPFRVKEGKHGKNGKTYSVKKKTPMGKLNRDAFFAKYYEAAEVNEISKGKLLSYIQGASIDKSIKAQDSVWQTRNRLAGDHSDDTKKAIDRANHKHGRRSAGIQRAASKIAGDHPSAKDKHYGRPYWSKVPATESVDEGHTYRQAKNAADFHASQETEHTSQALHHLRKSVKHLENRNWKGESEADGEVYRNETLARKHQRAAEVARNLMWKMKPDQGVAVHEGKGISTPTASGSPGNNPAQDSLLQRAQKRYTVKKVQATFDAQPAQDLTRAAFDANKIAREDVNEVSAKTLGSYIHKSSNDEKKRRENGIALRDEIRKRTGMNVGTPMDRKLYSPKHSRAAGRKVALDKLTGNAKVHATESVINELSKKTLKSYLRKAKDEQRHTPPDVDLQYANRKQGIKRALKRVYTKKTNK